MNKTLIALACCSLTSPALACAPLSPALQSTLERSARTFKLDSALLSALIWTESHFCMRARSPVGAIGLGQLMPGTARALGVNPHDPHQNIYGAAKYLSQMWKKFNNRAMAIAAYNAGPGAVQKYRGIPPYRETQAYVRKVLSAYPQQLIAMGRMQRVLPIALATAAVLRPASTLLAGGRSRSTQTRDTQARASQARDTQARVVRQVVTAARASANASVAMNTTLIARRRTAFQPSVAVSAAQPSKAAPALAAAPPVVRPVAQLQATPTPAAVQALQTSAAQTSAAQTSAVQTSAVQTPAAQTSMAQTPATQTPGTQPRTAQARTSTIKTRAPSAAPPESAPAAELASAPAQAEPFAAPTSLSLFDDAAPASGAPAPADSLNVFGDLDSGEAGPQGSVDLGAGGGAAVF